MTMKNILVVSRTPEAKALMEQSLSEGYCLFFAEGLDDGLASHRRQRQEVVFVDVEILHQAAAASDYQAVMQQFKVQFPGTEIVVMTAEDMVREAVRAVREGAVHYLVHPIIVDEVRLLLERLGKQRMVQSELAYLRDKFWQEDSYELLKTRCRSMQKVFENVRAVAPTRSTVLLEGETGTGKGVIARLIHRHSNRRDAQFISVHCGALSDTLLESELFGHEKGAFTGAVRRKPGKFEIARGGTLFLDEIGTITPAAQIKLLQILQDGIFQRVGGEETIDADVRVIAATNIDLRKLADQGSFRSDLFFRLNVFPIRLPPLRERRADIPQLAYLFLKRLNSYNPKVVVDIHPRVMAAFLAYHWPGNIREMENILERAFIIEPSSVLTPESFPGELFAGHEPLPRLQVGGGQHLAEVRRKAVEEVERLYLKEVLAEEHGRIRQSAERAGITTRQLHKLMKKYELKKEDFKS